MKPTVQNLVVMARLAPTLPIAELASQAPFDTSAKRSQHWLSLRVGPRARYSALYPNGRALSTGCTSLEEAIECLQQLWEMLPEAIRAARVSDVEIQNIVAVGDLKRAIPLDQLALARPDRVELEPEQFPGALMSTGGKGKALLFRSGKVVFTGTRSFDELDAAADTVEALIAEVFP